MLTANLRGLSWPVSRDTIGRYATGPNLHATITRATGGRNE